MATVATFVALGGSSYAAFALPKNSVGTQQLRRFAVTRSKIANGAVTRSKLNLTGVTAPTANQADNANHATTADTATNANQANTADTATNANHASTANNATNANHATTADTATNANHATTADTATNANHASTADTATNANQATSADTAIDAGHASNADHATNADALGDLAAGAYQQSCTPGAIAAFVYVEAKPTFSSTYTTSGLEDVFNCTGEVVEVKRTAQGVYDVYFDGLDDGTQLIAVGNQSITPDGTEVNGAELSFKLISDPTVDATVYQVRLDDHNGNTLDDEFSFALLSPS